MLKCNISWKLKHAVFPQTAAVINSSNSAQKCAIEEAAFGSGGTQSDDLKPVRPFFGGPSVRLSVRDSCSKARK